MIRLRTLLLVATLSLTTMSSHQLHGMELNEHERQIRHQRKYSIKQQKGKIKRIIEYLDANRSNPHNVVILIQHLYERHGLNRSIKLLKEAGLAKIIRHTIQNGNGITCLQDACCSETVPQGVIKIIITLADVYGAWNVIAFYKDNGVATSAWHLAIENEREDIVDLFIAWAAANIKKARNLKPKDNHGKGVSTLFFLQDGKNRTALHIAAAQGSLGIFSTILRHADARRFGLAWDLLLLADKDNHNLIDHTDVICGDNSDAIEDIIESYRIKYLLAGMNLMKLEEEDSQDSQDSEDSQ